MTIPLKPGEHYGYCTNCIIRVNSKLEKCFICGTTIIPFDPEKHSRSSLNDKENLI